jgi:hypothetical protein
MQQVRHRPARWSLAVSERWRRCKMFLQVQGPAFKAQGFGFGKGFGAAYPGSWLSSAAVAGAVPKGIRPAFNADARSTPRRDIRHPRGWQQFDAYRGAGPRTPCPAQAPRGAWSPGCARLGPPRRNAAALASHASHQALRARRRASGWARQWAGVDGHPVAPSGYRSGCAASLACGRVKLRRRTTSDVRRPTRPRNGPCKLSAAAAVVSRAALLEKLNLDDDDEL